MSKIQNNPDRERKSFFIDKNTWNNFIEIIRKNEGLDKEPRGQYISKALEGAIEFYTKLNCEHFQIEDIYLYRKDTDSKRAKKLLAAYEESIFGSRHVKMIGISFRDFLQPGGMYHKLLVEAIKQHNVRFTFILLDPSSTAAENRSFIEQGMIQEYTSRTLFRDLLRIILHYERELEPSLGKNIEIRFANESIPSYVIITGKSVFVEMYHAGSLNKVTGEEGIKIINPDHKTVCVGGYLPYFRYELDSNTGKLLSSHFDNMLIRNDTNDLKNVKAKVLKLINNKREGNGVLKWGDLETEFL